jgi:tRNA-intron endonuclease
VINLVEQNIVGELAAEQITIKDKKDASRLYNRGLYGTPLSGGGLKLELIEGFYLLDSEKLSIFKKGRALNVEEFLTYITKREPTFEIKYIVYRDLRLRGHIVKPSNNSDFVIFGPKDGKNGKIGKRQVKYWASSVSERARFDISEVHQLITSAAQTRKELLIGIVDEEGDLTYYTASGASPKGKVKKKKLSIAKPGSAVLIEDRVMLWSPELIAKLQSVGFFGKIVGSSLQLSLTESAYLLENKILEIKMAKTRRKLSFERFIQIARKLQSDFDLRLKVYRELKSRDLIVKTGFKYGTHFRVYEGDPDSEHSEYLVHGIPHKFNCSWEEVSRAVRLAQGVRKDMLFARSSKAGAKVEYINIGRIKP